MPSSNNTCHGFIMAHQATNADRDAPIDPYAVIRCPYPACQPKVVSASCKTSKSRLSCQKVKYCDKHHCGACKSALKAAQEGVVMEPKIEGQVQQEIEQSVIA